MKSKHPKRFRLQSRLSVCRLHSLEPRKNEALSREARLGEEPHARYPLLLRCWVSMRQMHTSKFRLFFRLLQPEVQEVA